MPPMRRYIPGDRVWVSLPGVHVVEGAS